MFYQKFAKLMLFSFILASILSVASAQTAQLKLRSVDGGMIDLNKEYGRVVVLCFDTTWSPLASRDVPSFQRLSDLFAGRGVSFYWVSINNANIGEKNYVSDDDLKDFAKRHGLRLTVLRDPKREAFRYFGLYAIPTLVILDREGRVNQKIVGFETEDSLGHFAAIQIIGHLLRSESEKPYLERANLKTMPTCTPIVAAHSF